MPIDRDQKPNETPDDLYGISAGRDYDDDVRQFIRAGRVEPAAATARRSVDGPDGPALHAAEVEAARHGAMPGDPAWVARARAAAHHAVDVVMSSIARAKDWWDTHGHTPKSGYASNAQRR